MQIEIRGMRFKVPEGQDPMEYAEKIDQQYIADEKAGMFDAASDSTWENLKAGVGRGLTNTVRNLGNILPGEKYDLVSNEELEEAKRLDADLMDTGEGQFGNFVGETAALLPLGVGVGAGAKALRGARTASTGLSKTRAALTGTPAQMGVEGAAAGYLLADPENRADAALVGGGFSAGLGKTLKMLKGGMTNPWAKKSAEALRTEARTGTHIPLSQSAEGIVKDVYSSIIANMPGVGTKFRKQYADAIQDFRIFAAERAFPGYKNYTPDPSKDMTEIMDELDVLWHGQYDDAGQKVANGAFDDALEPIADVPINIPKEVQRKLDVLNGKLPDGVPPLKAGGDAEVKDLVSMKTTIDDIINEMPKKEKPTIKMLRDLKDDIDGWVEGDLGPTFRESWDEYKLLKPYYKEYQTLKNAVSKEPVRGEFLPKAMARKNNSVETREIVADADRALQNFPSQGGIYQNMAALYTAVGLTGATAVAGVVGGPVAALATLGIPIAAAKVLASPKAQRMLAGELPIQGEVAKILKSPAVTRAIREGNRATVAGVAGDE